VDVATMTANVAQVFLSDDEWSATLAAIHERLTVQGHLVFETRIPERRAWEEWTPEKTRERVTLPNGETVESWCELLSVAGELVSFRWYSHFESDGATLRSDSTLRFRTRPELECSLVDAGFDVVDVRDAPDRPGREWVFVARAHAPTA
jgi:hypothetical protein